MRERAPGVAVGSRWLPAAGLLALFTVFLCIGQRDYYYKDLVHNEFTAKNMALAKNLSAERGLLFLNKRRNADGTVRYRTYNRFPIGAFALIKLAIAPFAGDSAAQLVAARMLMLAFFCAAAALAYLALARLTGSRAIALGATLLAFSSHTLLHYSDVVSNETSVDLFAVMLVFHGMVLFHCAAGRRFPQLAVKVCAALLLGWHVYGLLLPFLVFGAAAEAAAAWRGARAARPLAGRLGAVAWRVARGRHALLGALALVFGSGVLGYNIAREHAAFDGRRAVAELPSVRSMLRRTGIHAPHYRGAEELEWPTFVRWQFHRVGVACLPVALAGGVDLDEYAWRASGGWWLSAVGVVATIGAFAGLALFRRPRSPPAAAALALAGFCWACLARGNAAWSVHQYEGIFHVGVPLCLFAALLHAARRIAGGRAPAVCGAVAVVVFCASSVAMVLRHLDDGEAQTARARLAEFDAVAGMIRGKTVWVPSRQLSTERFVASPTVIDSLTAGGFVRYAHTLDDADPRVVAGLDFVLAFERHPIPALLTPNHRFVFLYRGGANIDAVLRALRDERRREHRRLEARPPAARPGGAARPDGARAGFDVHVVPRGETARAVRGAGELVYLKAPCGLQDTKGKFFVRLVPADANLPWEERRRLAFHTFPFETYGVVLDGACTMHLGLPTWPVAVVYTGQDHPAGASASWRVAFRLDVERLRAALHAARGETPTARGVFDLHMRRDSRRAAPLLLYARQPCTREDVRRRFFLHVVPDAVFSLPAARRRSGFANLDFDFGEHGALVDGACVALVELPDYDIAQLRTGQFDVDAPAAGRAAAWQVEFAPDAAGADR